MDAEYFLATEELSKALLTEPVFLDWGRHPHHPQPHTHPALAQKHMAMSGNIFEWHDCVGWYLIFHGVQDKAVSSP